MHIQNPGYARKYFPQKTWRKANKMIELIENIWNLETNIMIEAMLCGRVCIVTDVAGNTELLEDNISSFVAKAPKAELFDEAMERAWSKRDSWYDIGQVAAKEVRKVIPPDPIELFIKELKSLL